MKHLNLTILALLLSFCSFAQVAAITGPSTICTGSAASYTDATPGGTWTCTTGTLTISGSMGIAVGIAAGPGTITYTVGGVYATYPVTVDAPPAAISGATTLCVGGSVLEGDTTTGGTWTISPTTIATISTTGLVTGVSAGTATITYASMTGCMTTRGITVNPLPAPITGSLSTCVGSTTTLADVMTGGVWSSADVAVATVGTLSGIVTGTTAGVDNISYTLGTGCSSSAMVTVSPASATFTVSGGGTFCSGGAGAHILLSGSTVTVIYTVFDGGSPVGYATGTGAALDFGAFTAAGTYTVEANAGISCATTMTGSGSIVVNPLPVAYTISSGGAYCSGGTGFDITLSGSDIGVIYQLFEGGTLIGSPISGTGAPMDFGMHTAGIYTIMATNVTTGCSSNMTGSATITTTPTVVPDVSVTTGGGTTVCAGTTVTYTAVPVNGGTLPSYSWTVNGSITTTGSTYSYVPVNGDVINVTLYSSATCATPPTVVSTDVTMTVSTPTVTATAATASCGGVVTLTAGGATTYSWAPTTGLSCSGCGTATLSPAATTTYTVTGTDGGGCTNTATVTVDGNRISGHIAYTGVSTDVFKIWLIQFNPSDSSIAAQDSMSSCMDAGVPYYEFDDKAAGSYLVKAKLNGTVPGTSGYVPTYGTSAATWDIATSTTHASSANVMDITMIYGTVPAGPGFIAGYVVSGAGRTTAGDIPAAGMTIYLKNASGALVTYTTTATDGTYSFSNLANGAYYVYPENYKDYTTESAPITLATGADTVMSVGFKQHTSLGTITPYDNSKVTPVVNANTGITVYPNPTTGNTNIQWTKQATGNAVVSVVDMVGREVFTSAINMATASGQAQIALSNLNNGIYMITIKAGDMNYTGKLVIAKN